MATHGAAVLRMSALVETYTRSDYDLIQPKQAVTSCECAWEARPAAQQAVGGPPCIQACAAAGCPAPRPALLLLRPSLHLGAGEDGTGKGDVREDDPEYLPGRADAEQLARDGEEEAVLLIPAGFDDLLEDAYNLASTAQVRVCDGCSGGGVWPGWRSHGACI